MPERVVSGANARPEDQGEQPILFAWVFPETCHYGKKKRDNANLSRYRSRLG